MSPFGFVMQEVNAQIINHQQKHFMRSSWKILPIPNTLQVWVFSVNMQTLAMPQGKPPLPLLLSGMADVSKMITELVCTRKNWIQK